MVVDTMVDDSDRTTPENANPDEMDASRILLGLSSFAKHSPPQSEDSVDEVAAQYTSINALVKRDSSTTATPGDAGENATEISQSEVSRVSNQVGSNMSSPFKTEGTNSIMAETYKQLEENMAESVKRDGSSEEQDAASDSKQVEENMAESIKYDSSNDDQDAASDHSSSDDSISVENRTFVARVPARLMNKSAKRKGETDEIKVHVFFGKNEGEAAVKDDPIKNEEEAATATKDQIGSNTPSTMMAEAYSQLNKLVDSDEHRGSTKDQDAASDSSSLNDSISFEVLTLEATVPASLMTKRAKRKGETDEIKVLVFFEKNEDDAAVKDDSSSQARRSERTSKRSTVYNEDCLIIDNAKVEGGEEHILSGQGENAVDPTFVTSNGRKRKQEMQAVISDSEGEIQNVAKKRVSENVDQEENNGGNVKMGEGLPFVDCPIALREILESDFREQDRSYSTKYVANTVDHVWRRVPEHVKQSLPSEGNGIEELRKWKLKHFGEQTPRPVFVPNCPEFLIDMLREDVACQMKLPHSELTRSIKQIWNAISPHAKGCLPQEDAPGYFSELKKWKKLHARDAATLIAPPKKTTVRKRPRPSDHEKSPKSDDGRSSSYASSQAPQETPTQKVRHTTDGGKTAGNPVADNVPSGAQGQGTLVQEDDSNSFYVEEEAHQYHNPPLPSSNSIGVPPESLRRIPPPPPFGDLPKTGKCQWSWDNEQRVLLANFSSSVSSSNAFSMHPTDEAFFLQMMERNDVTLISEGLVSVQSLNPDYWKPEYLRRVLGNEYFHKFRRFDTVKTEDGFEKCFEYDGMVSMKVGDYIEYLEKRQSYLCGMMDGADPSFSFVNHEGQYETLDNVGTTALYMIDLDINRLLPKLKSNFLESFRYHDVLPGGSHCLMNSVTSTARPFMGPNMYVTPPAAFTHFHQDGHGTVDSGHLCISGYNEVVMLRRLTERHKKHALMILTGNFGGEENRNSLPTYFDGLYQEPHGDLLGDKPSWPTEGQIQKCRDMGYCPTVCIVKPGQLIHINKGRLHAFRKMSIAPLHEGDCHKKLREKTIEEHKLTKETLCVSIAWDWMYKGVSVGGINREISSVLEAVVLNRKNGRLSLAIPEFSLFQMAKMLNPSQKTASKLDSFLLFGNSGSHTSVVSSIPDAKTVCRGILPSLRHVMKQQLNTLGNASSSASTSRARGERVAIAKRPNTHEDPMKFPLDPYGLDGFACKLCSRELSNVYYHCDGCEKLLSKDFNICLECHGDKKFMCTVQMHPTNPKKHASLNHTGLMRFDRVSRCPCKNGPVCGHCNFCLGCSCRCHSWFTLHSRMFGEEEGKALLNGVDEVCASCDSDQSHRFGELLAERLEAAAKEH